MRKFGIVASVAILLSGCVSVAHRPLTAEVSNSMKGESVTSTRYQKPDFTAVTAGKASFGLIGGLAMVAAGNEIVEKNEIEDPATAIGEGLLQALASQRGMRAVASDGKVATSDKVPELLASYTEARYLLDVKTVNWLFGYYPTDWSHYRVIYNARLRLIDSSSRAVVAEMTCSTKQGDDANPPTRDQLLDNKAELLKSYLSKAGASCVDVLSRDVLRL